MNSASDSKKKTFVVALDGSDNSIRALIETCGLAEDGDEVYGLLVFV
jgi:hypothetical protein